MCDSISDELSDKTRGGNELSQADIQSASSIWTKLHKFGLSSNFLNQIRILTESILNSS